MFKHVEKALSGARSQAERSGAREERCQRGAVPEWKPQAATEGRPFSVSFALKKLS